MQFLERLAKRPRVGVTVGTKTQQPSAQRQPILGALGPTTGELPGPQRHHQRSPVVDLFRHRQRCQ